MPLLSRLKKPCFGRKRPDFWTPFIAGNSSQKMLCFFKVGCSKLASRLLFKGSVSCLSEIIHFIYTYPVHLSSLSLCFFEWYSGLLCPQRAFFKVNHESLWLLPAACLQEGCCHHFFTNPSPFARNVLTLEFDPSQTILPISPGSQYLIASIDLFFSNTAKAKIMNKDCIP